MFTLIGHKFQSMVMNILFLLHKFHFFLKIRYDNHFFGKLNNLSKCLSKISITYDEHWIGKLNFRIKFYLGFHYKT